MPNPYPILIQDTPEEIGRLQGELTFTDPSNQPGGGGGGSVNSVTAGDSSITVAGTATDPTVAVATGGVTSGKLGALAVQTAAIAAEAVTAAKMGSGAASINWVPVADGSGGVAYAASPGVNSLTAADASVVVGGSGSAPTVRTGTLDTIATQHPPTAAVAFNAQKITGLANGSASTDGAAFGQIPTALPPNGSASGDLSGTYPGPTVAAVHGVAVSGTAPSANQVLTASDATHAAWADSTGSSPLTTKGDIYGYSSTDARIPVGTDGDVLTADSAQTLGVKWSAVSGTGTVTNVSSADSSIVVTNGTTTPSLQLAPLNTIATNEATSGSVPMNSHKLTGLAAGTTAGDSVRYEQALLSGAVTAANTSVVVAGTGVAPTVRTGTLDVIATQEPPAAAWSNNSKKITSLANGTASSDAAAFGQIPTGAMRVMGPFTFQFNTASLNSGVAIGHTPAVGDLICPVIICTTAFNGTTPRADVATAGDTNGFYAFMTDGGIGADISSVSHLSTLAFSQTAPSGGVFTQDALPPFALVTSATALVVWASQNGSRGGTAVGGSAGTADVFLLTVTPTTFS